MAFYSNPADQPDNINLLGDPTLLLNDNGAAQTVSDGWTQAQSYASSAIDSANNFLNNLSIVAESVASLPLATAGGSFTGLDLSKFNYLVPTAPLTPGYTPNFTEQQYSSTYLSDVRGWVDAWVNGTYTGIAPVVEQQIWDKMRSQAVIAARKKGRESFRAFAMRGFAKPPGALSLELADAEQELQDAVIASSREIAIKQADLEQSNRRFAFEQAWKMEEGLINYLDQQMLRAVDMTKLIENFVLGVYSSDVTKYNAAITAYNARIQNENTATHTLEEAFSTEVNMLVETNRMNIQKMIQQVTLVVESVKAAAQVTAQLAASALSSVNLSAQIHDSTQQSAQMSIQSSSSTVDNTTNEIVVNMNNAPAGG